MQYFQLTGYYEGLNNGMNLYVGIKILDCSGYEHSGASIMYKNKF